MRELRLSLPATLADQRLEQLLGGLRHWPSETRDLLWTRLASNQTGRFTGADSSSGRPAVCRTRTAQCTATM